MNQQRSSRQTFPLRLPLSTRQRAIEQSEKEGISLNHFICLCVSEKLMRIEQREEQAKDADRRARIEAIRQSS